MLWADLDGARAGDPISQALPEPTLVVDSGHGLHLYWRLNTPVILDTSASREFVESVLRGMYLELCADSVQDVSRLLRLPGFLNVKDFQNGTKPTPCRIVEYVATRLRIFVCSIRDSSDYKTKAVPPQVSQSFAVQLRCKRRRGRRVPRSSSVLLSSDATGGVLWT
jgi:hypothetical protein